MAARCIGGASADASPRAFTVGTDAIFIGPDLRQDDDLRGGSPSTPKARCERPSSLRLPSARVILLVCLAGLPIAIKDNIHVRGLRTTASSKVLSDFVAQEDATCVEALRRAGAVIIGKVHTAEFAGPDPAPDV